MRPIVLTAGTAAAGSSALACLDYWAPPGYLNVACTAGGGACTFVVNGSLDDPNSPTNPVAVGSMTWFPILAAASGSTAQAYGTAAPIWVNLLVTSGPGNVTATIVQQGVAPY